MPNFAPNWTTTNSEGNVIASGSLAASGTTTGDIDLTNPRKRGALVQVKAVGGGSVAATNGCKVELFARVGSGPNVDTKSFRSFVIPVTSSTTDYKTFRVGPGRWRVKLTNLDASNAITVSVTTDTEDSTGTV